MKTNIKIAVVGLAILFAAGCAPIEKEEKIALENRWQKTTSKVKLRIAKEQFSSGQYDKAKESVERCLAENDQLADGFLLAGKIALVDGENEKAVEYFDKVVELDGQIGEAWYWKGNLAQQDSELSKAEQCYKKAVNLEPFNVDYIKDLGSIYAHNGEYEKANELYEAKIKKLPGSFELMTALAALKMQLGQYDEAISFYRQASLMDQDNRNIKESLGYCYILNQQWNLAGDTFEELSKTSDKSDSSNYFDILAVCNMNAGRYDKAFNSYNEISEKKRDEPMFWLKMGQAALGNNNFNGALACSTRALTLRHRWSQAIALQGSAQYLNRDYYSAMKSFKKISSNENDGSFAWMMIAKCYERLGRKSKAASAYKQSMDMKPSEKLAAFIN